MPGHYEGASDKSYHSSMSKKSSSSNKKGHHGNGKKAPSKYITNPNDPREKDDYLSGAMDSRKQGNKSFINTKITKGNTNTWWSTILDDVTGASEKNRSFFITNYERIRSNKPYLPTKQQFSLLTLEKKQDLYQKTRRDIMSSNQNQFGEPEGGGDGPDKATQATQATQGTQGTTGGQNIPPKKKEELIVRGAGTRKSSTIMTSVAGLEDEANVSQATLGGTILRKKKKYG